jgi:predicted HAD superfamily phosphohydrolase YqeG
MEIMVFVTTVFDREAVNRVKPLLAAVPAIRQWNFDLEDCDHILRVVSNNLSPRKVESLLHRAGFDCYELEY